MDELRQLLDDEARRVEAGPDPLEAVKRRVGRRRVKRQVGTGVVALAIAGSGFALAFEAFQTGRPGRPLVGPTESGSPSGTPRPSFQYEDIVRFVDAFVYARKNLDAEAFLSPGALGSYFTPNDGGPRSWKPFLYPDAGILEHRVVKFDRYDADTWILEVQLHLARPTVCYPEEVTERLFIHPSIGEGVEGLLVTGAGLIEPNEELCPPAGILPSLDPGAPPAIAHLEQGDEYWAVYLVVTNDREYIAAVANRMEKLAVPTRSGSVTCDRGGPEFEDDVDFLRVAAYFGTREEAEAFRAAITPRLFRWGVFQVETFCLD